ncbi:hypothetical protein HMN09_01391700 [Mycena chlorophos]|uniref:Uncharacterized protein n=1 Tax=Mycena chlorophos TaxID=658473 RepID=A0A8H6VSH2_MYCCL|nr:hypothetical protein HMN09_01391700 [Mycena chlorophos]
MSLSAPRTVFVLGREAASTPLRRSNCSESSPSQMLSASAARESNPKRVVAASIRLSTYLSSSPWPVRYLALDSAVSSYETPNSLTLKMHHFSGKLAAPLVLLAWDVSLDSRLK